MYRRNAQGCTAGKAKRITRAAPISAGCCLGFDDLPWGIVPAAKTPVALLGSSRSARLPAYNFLVIAWGGGGLISTPSHLPKGEPQAKRKRPPPRKPLSPALIGQRPVAASGGNGKGGGPHQTQAGRGPKAEIAGSVRRHTEPRSLLWAARLGAAGCLLSIIYPQRGRRRAAALNHRRRAAGCHAWKAGNGATAPKCLTLQRAWKAQKQGGTRAAKASANFEGTGRFPNRAERINRRPALRRGRHQTRNEITRAAAGRCRLRHGEGKTPKKNIANTANVF